MKKYLTIDVGRSKLKYAIINEELDVLKEGFEYSTSESKDELFQVYKKILDDNRTEEIEGISVSMPGVIDMESGFAYSGGIYHWVRNMPYADELSAYLGVPVAICNDAKAAAFAEIGYGSLKKVKNGVLLMLLGTGIGGAVVVDGHLLNGHHFAAGEFSYIKGDYRARDEFNDTFSNACSMNAMADVVSQYCGRKMNIMNIMAGISAQDQKITEGMAKFCDMLAVYIYNIQCVIDAEKFVLSGNVTDEPLMLDMMRAAVDRCFEHSQYHNIFKPDIAGACFHDNARMFGAVYHFKQIYEKTGEDR